MTLQQELFSWRSPPTVNTASLPQLGTKPPSLGELSVPNADGKPRIVTFLRHCGCPFAEKTFVDLRSTAAQDPDVQFVAVSHSTAESTQKWIEALKGAGQVEFIVDPERRIYAAWGLGITGWWHVLNPRSLWSIVQLGRGEGIWNRPTESGSRWQMAGSFGIDRQGVLRWTSVAESAEAIPDFEEGIRVLKSSST